MAGKSLPLRRLNLCFVSSVLLFSIVVPVCLAVDEELYQAKENVSSLIDAGKFSEAAVATNKLSSDFAGNSDLPWAFYWIAERYQRFDRFEDAKGIYQQIIQNFPDSPWAGKARMGNARAEAISLVISGKYAEAKEVINKMASDFVGSPDLPEALFWIAERYQRIDKFDEAKHLYQRIIDEFPNNPFADKAKFWLSRANVASLIVSGDFAGAQGALDKLVTDFAGNPDLPEALFWLTKLSERVNRPDDANQVYQLLKQKFPTSSYVKKTTLSDAKAKILSLFESQDYNNVDEAVNKMVSDFAASPDLPETLFWIAERYQRVDKFESASAIWQQIIKNWPDKPQADKSKFWFSRIGVLSLIVSQNYDGAKTALDKFTADFARNPDFPEALYWIAERYERIGRADDAKGTYQRLIDQFPNNPYAKKAKLGIPRAEVTVLVEARDFDNADIALNKMVSDFAEHPDLPRTLYWLAVRYQDIGRTEDATMIYQKIVQNYPNSPYAAKAKAGNSTGSVVAKASSTVISSANTSSAPVQDSNQILDQQKAGENLYQSACEYIDACDINKVLVAIAQFVNDFPESQESARVIFSIGDYCYKKTIIPDGSEIADENSVMFWNSAIKIWEPIITKLPDSNVTPKTCYASGLCYYHLGDCNSAINYFQKLNNEFPEYDNICVSLLLTANCYDKMAFSGAISKEEAGEQIRNICGKIISHYPDSPIVVPARTLLRHWENQNSNQ